MNLIPLKSDAVGILASTLCLIHCFATPFLFVAQSCSVSNACCDASPAWWSNIDFAFIGITLAAVFFSARNTSRDWMRFTLYGSWLVLTSLIVNEKMDFIHIAEEWTYGAAFGLISLHFYNRKFCKCADANCYVN